ncbi:hypothetical protein BDK88_4053 [Natrinema hispanicum]|uniref:Uncharacterized protein n=1 Tax=Natrinema hispanicum TaxID=392421 RepID=A0A482YB75_9EURY|nr:hypothetical protein BDK88_4053 [Natrinema hispanicum]
MRGVTLVVQQATAFRNSLSRSGLDSRTAVQCGEERLRTDRDNVVGPLHRDTARVPRGLTPRVNRVSYMMDTTVLESTVATWIKDLNPKQLPAVARNATPLKTRVFGVVRQELSGRGGAADPHGRTERSGINSRRLVTGSPRGIKFACDRTARFGTCGQNGEAAGLAPAVLHYRASRRFNPRGPAL